MILRLLFNALFAGLAAIGFASISRPPRSAYLFCALIAAAGHTLRYLMMNWGGGGLHIVAATTIASFAVGLMAVFIAPHTKVPAETYLFPSLLPMIPGIYAYKCFGALMMCLSNGGEQDFNHCFYLFASNGLTCFFILVGMVVGATVPIFMYKRFSFQATRRQSSTDNEVI